MLDLAHGPTLFNPDDHAAPALALYLDVRDNNLEQPVHQHRKGQLVVARRGSVTCVVDRGVWVVPHQCGVWIPGGISHSNRVSINGEIAVLFIDPADTQMPDDCCTFAIPPLVREMIAYLANQPLDYKEDSTTGRLARVLIEHLGLMPLERLKLPLPSNHQLRRIARALTKNPSNRNTIGEWASQVGLSERTLARLVISETGMTFGRWRRQFHIIVALQRLSIGIPVARVSEQLGYESVNAFITMFKKALGKTPGHYMPNRITEGGD
jgi:AraC-like DNA-binding protein